MPMSAFLHVVKKTKHSIIPEKYFILHLILSEMKTNIVHLFVTKWIKSCLLQCFGTFKMPILMFISVLVFRPEGQI